MKIECGVPQGSVLGPLLFLLYTNDLPKSVTNSQTILFADDTTIYVTGNKKESLFRLLKDDLSDVIDWFRANKLSLNISKTNYVLFEPPDNIKIHDPTSKNEYKLEFGTETIDQVSHVKFLGLMIDKNLNWNIHAKGLICLLYTSDAADD